MVRNALRFSSAARTHAGAVRPLNEDALLDRPDLGLWAVADGMGGHDAGDVASALVVEALGRIDAVRSGYGFLGAVCASLQEVNSQLVARAALLPGGGLIGATVAALLIFEGHYACVWAGDSRAYRLRGGKLSQLTRDHSFVQALVEAGGLSAAGARRHPSANIVTRAVGGATSLRLEVEDGTAAAGDVFLLCSDGLTGALEDAEMEALLAEHGLAAADPLLDLALAHGAADNVSFVLVAAQGA